MADHEEVYLGDRERLVVETRDLDHNITDPTSLTFVVKYESGTTETFTYGGDDDGSPVTRRATGMYFITYEYKETGLVIWGVELTGNMQRTAKETLVVRPKPW